MLFVVQVLMIFVARARLRSLKTPVHTIIHTQSHTHTHTHTQSRNLVSIFDNYVCEHFLTVNRLNNNCDTNQS